MGEGCGDLEEREGRALWYSTEMIRRKRRGTEESEASERKLLFPR